MSDLQTLSFYLFIFLLTMLLCVVFQKTIIKNKENRLHFINFLICLIIATPLLLVAGLRDDSVGSDTLRYSEIYLRASDYSLADLFFENDEDHFFYFIVFAFAHTFKEPTLFYLFMQACAIFPLLWVGIMNIETIDLWKIMSVYCFWHYNDSLNNLRQMVAISLLFLAVEMYLNKKVILSAVITFICIGFHSSTLMVVPFILLMLLCFRKQVRTSDKLFIIAGTIIILIFGQNLFITLIDQGYLSSRYILYVDTFIYEDSRVADQWISVGLGGFFEVLARLVIFFPYLFFAKHQEISFKNNLYILFFAINIVIYVIGLTIYKTAYFVRLSLFFDFFGILIIPYLESPYNTSDSSSPPKRSFFFTGVYSCLYWIIHVFFLGQSGSIPYFFRK